MRRSSPLARRIPRGARISIHHNPENPAEATIEPVAKGGLPMMIITPTVNLPAQRVAVKLGFSEVRRAWFQGTLCCFFRHPDE